MAVPCNVGGTERAVRIGMGAALLGTALAAPIPKPVRITAGILGAIELVTGLTRYCPVNQALHRDTCHL